MDAADFHLGWYQQLHQCIPDCWPVILILDQSSSMHWFLDQSKSSKRLQNGCGDYGAELGARLPRLHCLGSVVEVFLRLAMTIKLNLLGKAAITSRAVILLLGNVVGSILRGLGFSEDFLDASSLVEVFLRGVVSIEIQLGREQLIAVDAFELLSSQIGCSSCRIENLSHVH